MPRGAFKSKRGVKERKVRQVVSRMSSERELRDYLSNVPSEDRETVVQRFGKYIGDALPESDSMPVVGQFENDPS